ncbi:hypothetical protein DFH11DRAFT_488841 [Phellopilus nigrolimitatus]|nr:hypothetical protein DFH11DRAFT_488841 [Phellopilus nigrolimitatus]
MLIPNGHLVTPISQHHKRSGNTPSPIRIINSPQRSMPYAPLSGDDGAEMAMGGSGPNECQNTPSTGEYTHAQTFPETPVLFSPDFPVDVSPPGSCRILGRMSRSASMQSNVRLTQYLHLRNAVPRQPIVIPSTPQIPVSPKTQVFSTNEFISSQAIDRSRSPISTLHSNSPPISPLEPPPPPSVISLTATLPYTQIASENGRPSPPLLTPVLRKKTVRSRPPLPFGPRKPSNPLSIATPPLSLTPRRKAFSEGVPGMARIMNTKPEASKRSISTTPLSSPTFKTTPVRWRALTLDAAIWTFTSAQLQIIVRRAIEQSARSSSIRLLPQEVLDMELTEALERLEARKTDIQSSYKVLVRRRRDLLQRLVSYASNANNPDVAAIARVAEEVADVTGACDRLTEELHDVCDQIAQIRRLNDVHLASALAMALRKLHASLIRRDAQVRAMQAETADLRAEKEEAWQKAQEIERDLDALNEQVASAGESSNSAMNSQRSSRVSSAQRGSARTSKAGLRLSSFGPYSQRHSLRLSGSSLRVKSFSSVLTTSVADAMPPVPPVRGVDASAMSSGLSSHTHTTHACTSAGEQSLILLQ